MKTNNETMFQKCLGYRVTFISLYKRKKHLKIASYCTKLFEQNSNERESLTNNNIITYQTKKPDATKITVSNMASLQQV